jgi:hypothetical protein
VAVLAAEGFEPAAFIEVDLVSVALATNTPLVAFR